MIRIDVKASANGNLASVVRREVAERGFEDVDARSAKSFFSEGVVDVDGVSRVSLHLMGVE